MRIFILHAGGLGDLVLFAPALQAIRRAMPQARITLCCRLEFASIVELFPFCLNQVLGLAFNPYACDPFEAFAFGEVSALIASHRVSEPDLFIGAEFTPTWLTPLLIAAMRPVRALATKNDLRSSTSLQTILERFDLFTLPCESYGTGEAVTEHARYDAMLEHIGVPIAESLTFQFPERVCDEVARVINAFNIGDALMLACFTAGNALVPIKRWPLDRFLSVIEQASHRHTLIPVFFGDASERVEAEEAVRTLGERGVLAHAHIDETQSVSLTAAILARASAFLGNDTGLAHLCAALRIPGVTVYGGGGYFERYEPWAAGTIGLVHRLPCFGCAWDCSFGHAVCLESIETADVVVALDRVLEAPPLVPEVVELSHRTESELSLIGDAARTYRAMQTDRIGRLEVIAGLQREVESIREEMLRQSVAAAERLGVIEELKAHIAALRGEREAAAREAEKPLLRHIGVQETMIRELGKEIESH